MGITKQQLVNTATKLKTYTDSVMDDKLSKAGMNFTSEDGFGNLRWYNGHFQIFDTTSQTWVDTSVSPENVYVINMLPQAMQSIRCIYDSQLQRYKLKFIEPNDTIVDGQIFCAVNKVIIRRKLNSVPETETDGDLVVEIKRKDFGNYANKWYIDNSLVPNIGDEYYYKAFPVSSTGFVNYSPENEIGPIMCKDHMLYGFKIDQNESDPASMITYIEDNSDFESAKMDFTNDVFNYGSWENAWFMECQPCMLKYDGTVDYYLNPNDYTKKADGTVSDVSNTTYEGNAMIEFPKVYWKITNNSDNTVSIYFSNKKIDDNFHCWSHIDNNGNEIDYCYMPIYNGVVIDGKMRSLSGGQTPTCGQSATNEITYAKANNAGDDTIWYTEVFSDRILIDFLLMLISKSTDAQSIFGYGYFPGNSGVMYSGAMDTKGMFWGNSSTSYGVKVFGMEHYWGNRWRRIAGWINANGTQKVKLTYGKQDGSTVDGYNTDGSGYISVENSTIESTGYITKMIFGEFGMLPIKGGGSSTTYYNDKLIYSSSQSYAIVGGSTYDDCGLFQVNLECEASYGVFSIGSAISCKPLAIIE